MVGGTVGKGTLRERTVRAVPQIRLARNPSKNGRKKFSPEIEAYSRSSERLGCEGSAGIYGYVGGTFYNLKESGSTTGRPKNKTA